MHGMRGTSKIHSPTLEEPGPSCKGVWVKSNPALIHGACTLQTKQKGDPLACGTTAQPCLSGKEVARTNGLDRDRSLKGKGGQLGKESCGMPAKHPGLRSGARVVEASQSGGTWTSVCRVHFGRGSWG